jgi:Protein of unknown function (DUF664)
MSKTIVRTIDLAPGFPSTEIGSFIAQLDDQNSLLERDTRGAAPAELAWQMRPGTNTIGMLIAHIAIVEVYWLMVANQTFGDDYFDRVHGLLGIGPDDDGIPAAPDALPPATLAGKDLAFYDDLMARARRHTRDIAVRWHAADVDAQVSRVSRRDGSTWNMNRRWILYHVLEHQAGHYYQINLLRHLYREHAKVGAPA